MTENSRVERLAKDEIRIDLEGLDQFALLGFNDTNLALLQDRYSGTMTVRGGAMLMKGAPADTEALCGVVIRLIELLQRDKVLDRVTVSYALEQAEIVGDQRNGGTDPNEAPLFYAAGDRTAIRPRTDGQDDYIAAIKTHDVVFAIGPAGTGKTYLAVVMAMDYLRRGLVERVILVRPAVEAGEQLGFLPGDLQEKIDPYLRPLYDALSDTIGASKIQRFMASGVIEAAPLAYMRGRTLNHAFVILDEAQNTTIGQMKMFLTRMGRQCKSVITGDVTQIDLDVGRGSGLVGAQEILKHTEGVAFVELKERDVVRHPMVRRIIAAFAEAEAKAAADEQGEKES